MTTSSARNRILSINIPPASQTFINSSLVELDLDIFFANQVKSRKQEIENKKYDLIVIALNENGLKDLVKIKRSRKTDSIPVIMFDTQSNHEKQVEALRKGAFQIIGSDSTNQQIKLAIISGLNSVRSMIRLEVLLKNHKQSIENLHQATFTFTTLSEAHVLAQTLSLGCLEVNKVAMGLTEILVNAVEHGNLGFSYEDKSRHHDNGTWHKELEKRQDSLKYKDKYVTVKMERHDEMIKFTVIDQGTGFDYEKYMSIDPQQVEQEHGRGISLARLVAFEKLEYLPPGNQVVMYAKSTRTV